MAIVLYLFSKKLKKWEIHLFVFSIKLQSSFFFGKKKGKKTHVHGRAYHINGMDCQTTNSNELQSSNVGNHFFFFFKKFPLHIRAYQWYKSPNNELCKYGRTVRFIMLRT